ncbi:hypothetical protein DXG01_006075, partial [Tephrocybe rancida]
LKRYLLPRVRSSLSILPELTDGELESSDLWQSVHMKHEQIYKHNIMHIHYTTYDVHRGEDVVHINTHKRNIMVLNPLFTVDNGQHPFWYARILGIYHANVFYLGEGNTDYQVRRFELLWVRWYSPVDEGISGWKHRRLDCISFPRLLDCDSFGFLDPADVLRSCHVIPRFSAGKASQDVWSLSPLAQDLRDWKSYYINQDMAIHYHWGLSVGHVYSHSQGSWLPPEENASDEEDEASAIVTDPSDVLPASALHLADMLALLESMEDSEEINKEEKGFEDDWEDDPGSEGDDISEDGAIEDVWDSGDEALT